MDDAAVIEEIAAWYDYNRLEQYKPYPKQYDFHAAGRVYRERLLMKGNQVGGTLCGAAELAFHVTGRYPEWWPGMVYDHPVKAWVASESTVKTREIMQAHLLGTEITNISHPSMGRGMIPRDAIAGVTKKQAGVRNVADQIFVHHSSGGTSVITLKEYEMGWEKFTGDTIHFFWPDEEPKEEKTYFEGVTRTQAHIDGRSMMTFTPLRGRTPIIDAFLTDQGDKMNKSVTNMTIWDAVDGVWPEGTFYAGKQWKGHYTREHAQHIVDGYPPHLRKTKEMGVPLMGEGMVFPFDEDEIKCHPFEIPRHWARIAACDFGIGHPGAGVWLAHDGDTDSVYVYDCYKKEGEGAVYHAAAFKKRDPKDAIPVAWPHDGIHRDKGSGIQLWKAYKTEGVKMMKQSARHDDAVGGPQSGELAIGKIYDMMMTDRFKVFSHLEQWFEEMRMYHRKEGVVVAKKDDIMKATQYAMMELRHAKRPSASARGRHASSGYSQSIAS